MTKAEDIKPGNYIKYIGGNSDLDLKGFLVDHKYLVAGDPSISGYRYVQAPNGDDVCIVDVLGHLSGKSQYFETAGFDEWERVWRKGFATPEETKNCLHEWTEYIGFNDSFTYCSKCDIKKG